MKPDNGQFDLQRLRSTDAPELHRAIDAVKQQLPDSQQLASLAASLSQMGISVAHSGNATAVTSPSATRLKLLLGAGVVGPLTLALFLWHPASRQAAAPTAAAPSVPSASAVAPTTKSQPVAAGSSNEVARRAASSVASGSAAPEPSSQARDVAAPENRPLTSASPEPVKSVPRATGVPTSSTESTRSPVAPVARSANPESTGPGVVARPTEVALLRDARLALNGSPTEALALAEQHRALYPRGAMVQERELIAISALARLGRHSAVLSRAAQFERDFPTSPYRKQVNALAQ